MSLHPVLFMGGSGAIGHHSARALRAAHPDVPSLIGGRDLAKAQQTAKEIGGAQGVLIDPTADNLGLNDRPVSGVALSSRAIVMQQKTQHPVQFEVTEQTRTVLEAWMHQARLHSEDFLFPTRLHNSDHLSTRQYARIVKAWVTTIGLDPPCTVLTRSGEPRHR